MSSISIVDFFNNWLNNLDEEIILVLGVGKNFTEIENFYEIALNNKYIKNIQYIYSEDKSLNKDTKITKYNAKLFNLPVYCFLDFSVDEKPSDYYKKETNGDERDITFLFNKAIFRRHVKSFLFFNYNGIRPINNFWIPDNYNYTDFVSFTRSTWAEMTQKLQNGPSTNIENDLNFKDEFKKYISTILSYIIEEEYISLFIDEKYMNKWIQSITHFTYNNLYNYESLEFDGDSCSKFSFRDYMIKKYPKFVANELSEYSNQYMSRTFQSVFSDDLLLLSWMMYDPIIKDRINKNEKVKTDILESFTGALKQIGNDIEDGIGIIACCNLYTILGESLSFPDNMSYGTHITQVIQMNKKMGFSNSSKEGSFFDSHEKKEKAFIIKIEKVLIKGTDNINNLFTIEFNPSFLKFLTKNGIDITLINKKIDHHQPYNEKEKESEKEANAEIYSKIYKTYIKIGITQDFASHVIPKDILFHVRNFDRTLIDKLETKLGEDFNRVNFTVNNDLDIIIMFLDIYNVKTGKSGIKSLSHDDIKLEPKNLVVSNFFSSVPREIKVINQDFTNLDYSKLVAIDKYLNL